MNQSGPLAIVRYPLQGSVLGVIVLIAVLTSVVQWLVQISPILGLPAIFLVWVLAVGTVQYWFIVLRESAMGKHTAPLVEAADFHPFSTPTPALAVVVVTVAAGLVLLARNRFGPPADLIVAAIIVFFLPAAMALLTLNGSFAQSISPLHIGATIVALRLPYLLMPAAIAGAAVAIRLLELSPAPALLRRTASLYVLFLAAHILGRVLYQWRDRIGLEPLNPDIMRAEQEQRLRKQARADVLEHAYRTARVDQDKAVEMLLAHLNDSKATLDDRRLALEHVLDWACAGVTAGIGKDLVARELSAGQSTQALASCAKILAAEPRFRPATANQTLTLAKLAMQNGRHRVVTALLSDFADRHPDDASALPAKLMCAKTALEHTGENALADRLIADLETNGRLADDPRLAYLKQAAQSAGNKT